MAKAEAKIIDRIQKLWRLASPTSGSTEAERASAALTALDMMDKHGISLDINTSNYRAAASSEERTYAVRDVWMRVQSQGHSRCSACSNLISPGDMIYVRPVRDQFEYEFRHHYCIG